MMTFAPVKNGKQHHCERDVPTTAMGASRGGRAWGEHH